MRKELQWWNGLSKSKQIDLEYQTFGYGEPWEDNTLTDDDIIHMYKKYKK